VSCYIRSRLIASFWLYCSFRWPLLSYDTQVSSQLWMLRIPLWHVRLFSDSSSVWLQIVCSLHRISCVSHGVYILPLTQNVARSGLQFEVAYWPTMTLGGTAQLAAAHCPNERSLDPAVCSYNGPTYAPARSKLQSNGKGVGLMINRLWTCEFNCQWCSAGMGECLQAGKPSQYVISHPGQLSLVIPLCSSLCCLNDWAWYACWPGWTTYPVVRWCGQWMAT